MPRRSSSARKRLRDRVAGAVADLQEPRQAGAAAARKPVAAVRRARTRRRWTRARRSPPAPRTVSTSHQLGVGGAVRRGEHVLRHAARASRRDATAAWMPPWAMPVLHDAREPFGHEHHLGTRAGSGPRGRQTGAAAADHEHVRTPGKVAHRTDGTQAVANRENKTGLYQPALPDRPGPSRRHGSTSGSPAYRGDHVDVVVEDGLPGGGAVRLHDRHAVGASPRTARPARRLATPRRAARSSSETSCRSARAPAGSRARGRGWPGRCP